jgi:hypothetical protein
MSSVTLNVQVREHTALALLVSNGLTEAWVPISQIEGGVDMPTVFGTEPIAIVIPTWLATDKGLLPRNQDTDTVDMFRGAA